MTSSPTKKNANRRLFMILIIALIIIVCAIGVLEYVGVVHVFVSHVPIRYDLPFHSAISKADRMVVRSDGFDCCGPIDETAVLFSVNDAKQVMEIASHLQFVSLETANSYMEACLCCGGPGMDWYKGEKRIALTAFQHGRAIRWKGFSTARLLGMRIGYGDGPLTKESQEWLDAWFKKRGLDLASYSNLK